jgi:hypothetical protein
MDTHSLKSAEGRTSQDIKRHRVDKWHSLPREHRGRHKSGQKGCELVRGTHTLERAEGDASREWNECERAGSTHLLESAEGETSKDMKIKVSERTIKALNSNSELYDTN